MRISKLFDFDNEFTDEMFDDLDIPEETPEEKSAKLKRLMELVKEREKEQEKLKEQKKALIAQEPVYDEFTKKAIDTFVERLLTLYPDILPRNEIYDRIHANLKSSIEFKDFIALGKPLSSGFFLPQEHRIFIADDRKGIALETSLFHEFCHVLVDGNPYDDLGNEFHREYENSNFITETIITLMEEDCYRKILHGKRRRANGYIAEYSEQLRAILGDEIIYSFVRRFKFVDDLICQCDEDSALYSDLPYNLIGNIDPVWYKLNYPESTGTDKSEIAYQNASIELVFTLMLDNYLTNTDLSDEEKMDKIEELFNHQQDPNFKVFKELIEKHIKDKAHLEDNKVVNYLYRVNMENYEYLRMDKEHSIIELLNSIMPTSTETIRDKYKKYAVKEMFGVNEYAFREDDIYPLPKYDKNKFIAYHKSKETFMALYSIKNAEDAIYDSDVDIDAAEMYNCVLDEKAKEPDEILNEGNGASELESINLTNNKIKMAKIITKSGKDYYLSYELYPEIFKKRPVGDLLIETNEKLSNATTDEEKEFYKAVLRQQSELLKFGITEAYENKNGEDMRSYRCVYEKDGKVYHSDIHEEEKIIYNEKEVFQLQKMKTLSPVSKENIMEDTKLKSTKKE